MNKNILNDNILNCSIDLGKNEVKGFSYDNLGHIKKIVNFDSVIRKVLGHHTLSSDSNPNKFKIEIEGKKFEIGDSIEKGNYCNENSKVNSHHRLCLLVALGLLLDHDRQQINVSVGLPSSHISNPEERKAFEEFLKGEEGNDISIIINGEHKFFTINSITPESEGLAILPRLKLMLSDNTFDINVIDIGGHNFNLRLFDKNGYSIEERGISEEQVGINNLLNNLHIELLSNLKNRDRKVSKSDLKKFVIQKSLDKDMELSGYTDTSCFIEEFVDNYIEEYIADKLSSHSVKIQTKGRIHLFTGGGALLLKPYIENLYNDNLDFIMFSETSKWDNCISFALNRLFKLNPDKAQIFQTINSEALNKLPHKDKSKNSYSYIEKTQLMEQFI